MRQYKKNIGRTLIVKTNTENIEAELVEANDDFVILSWKAREPKKIGKGKETVQKTVQIPYTEINEAIVTVTF
jgi:ribosome maturation factor RimP